MIEPYHFLHVDYLGPNDRFSPSDVSLQVRLPGINEVFYSYVKPVSDVDLMKKTLEIVARRFKERDGQTPMVTEMERRAAVEKITTSASFESWTIVPRERIPLWVLLDPHHMDTYLNQPVEVNVRTTSK